MPPNSDNTPGYHNGEALICADCHIMHASRSHEDPALPGAPAYAGGANPYLLTAPDPLDLCLSCHDGQPFAPDVVGADANGLTERSAGWFDEPEVESLRGHDLGRGLPPAPDEYCYRCHFGAGDQQKVTCIDCHNPHGNGIARNLQWASYPAGTPPLGLFVSPSATGMSRYETANVSYGTQDSDMLREPTNMCIDCHHTFSGAWYVDPEGDGVHVRHPSYDSERGSPNSIDQGGASGGSNPAHWTGGTGSGFYTLPRLRGVVAGATTFGEGTVVDAETNGVFCLSCHKAHGSEQAFGSTFPFEDAYETACDQCHDKGRVPAPSSLGGRPRRSQHFE